MGKIQCLQCDKILHSKFRHDFQACDCPNQSFVDGGDDYIRIGGKDLNKIKVIKEVQQILVEHAPLEEGSMLRVKIEMVPKGIESKKRTLSKVEITNRKTRRIIVDDMFPEVFIELSDYGVRVDGKDYGTMVHDFDRSQGAYKLIKKVCDALEKKGILK